MKRTLFVILAVFTLLGATSLAIAQDKAADKLIAYYFHGTFRCYTCTNIERFSREAIEANFKDALASGRLEFKAVNVEEKGNEHFVNDYRLYTKALIISLVKDGKELKHKNLDKIWQLARNEEKFIEYVTSEVADLLKEAQ